MRTRIALMAALAMACPCGAGQAAGLDLGSGCTGALDPATGAWVSLRTPAGDLAKGRNQAAFEICDLEKGTTFVPVVGPVDASGHQRAALDSLGLQADITYEQRNGHLRAKATITDKTGKDRGLVVRFCLPVDATGWQWWDDVQATRSISAGKVYQNVYPIRYFADLPEFRNEPAAKLGYHSRNFCAAVTGRAGLAMAFPLDEPRICRLAYDSTKQILFLAFDLGLSRHTQPPSQASVTALAYGCDAKWGMRSAVSKYYQWYPGLFTKHVKREGIWMAFDDLEYIDNANEFGFQFQEGACNPGYDDKLGVYSFTYFTHAGIFAWIPNYDPEKDPPASRERKVAAMSKRFERNIKMKGAFQAVGLGAADGTLQIRDTAVYGHIISQFNLDPDLPYGKYKLDHMKDTFARFRERGGELDGFYYDGITSGINYRTDHFKYADFPPVWDPHAHKPLLYNYFSSTEFAAEAVRRLHKMGKYAMMNGAMSSSPFAAPHLDVMGSETGLRIGRSAFNYVRMICRSKPFVTLLKGNFSKFTHDDIELYIRRCVAYGVYPSIFDWPPSGLGPGSRYWEHAEWYERDRGLFRHYVPICREINAAGWDPLTHATCADANLQIERFGKTFFTVLNDGPSAVDSRVVLDTAAMGLDASKLVAIDEVARIGLPAKADAGKLAVPLCLGPGQLVMLHVNNKRDFAASHVAEIQRMFAERKRMAEIDKTRIVMPVHWRTRGYAKEPIRGRTDDGGNCLLFDNTAKRANRGARQWVMLYQDQPKPIEIRLRVKAQGIEGKPDNNFALHAMVCHVTRFTKRVKNSFPLPRGTYDWKDVRFEINPDRPVRSIWLRLELSARCGGRAWIDNVVVAPVAKPDVNYVVDSTMDDWYEQPTPDQAKQFEVRFASVDAALDAMNAALRAEPYDQSRVIAACGQAIDAANNVRGWIDDSKLGNPLRRARRELDDFQSHCQLMLTTLADVTGPTIQADMPAIPGRHFVMTVAAQKSGQPAEMADVQLDAPQGWAVKPLGKDATGHRFEIAVPKDAQVGETATIKASARVKATGDTWVSLSQTRSVAVTRAVTTSLKKWGGSALRLEVVNHCPTPMRVAYQAICPKGWRPQPAKAELICPAHQTRAADIRLVPASTVEPDWYSFSVKVGSPADAFETETLDAELLYIPERLNLLKNGGFEQVAGNRAAHWSRYPDGYALDSTIAHSGKRSLLLDNTSPGKRGASQGITLNQKFRCPIIVRGWSKAKDVASNAGRDYSLYTDIYYTDGSSKYGNTIRFGTGTHDWVYGELIIEPTKPIRTVNVYALHRRVKGIAWFDDIFVAEIPGRGENIANQAKVSVDSCFSKYHADPLTDGVTQTAGLHWTEADWASADKAQPHWIEFAFPTEVEVKRVKMFWSLDAGKARTSREFVVQTKTDAGWTDLERVKPPKPVGMTRVSLADAVRTKALRIYQPAGAGPAGRPNLMWVREVEVVGK